MAQTSDVKESAVLSSGPEDRSESVGSSNEHPETSADGFKTILILKEWPIITSTVNKTRDIYEWVKNSSRILQWGCGVAEQVLGGRWSGVAAVVHPALRIADLAASQMAEQLQHRMPVVTQPPQQVSDAVRSGLSSLMVPLNGKVDFIVSKGKRRTRNAAKSIVQIYRKLVLYLDKWMEEVEKYFNTSKSKGVQAPQVQEAACVPPLGQVGLPSLMTRAASAAASAALFGVGVSVCVASRLPVVGALLHLSPASSPASSKSTSPVRQAELPSTHSSQSTNADVAEAEQRSGNLPVPENKDAKDQSEK